MARFRPMLREHGLTEQQWRVIRTLAAFERLDASELAARSFLLAPSLTRILQHLEKENVVKRSPDRSDQRRSFLMLTKKGRQIFARVGPDSEVLYKDIEKDFGTARLETLYELLTDFYTVLEQQSEK